MSELNHSCDMLLRCFEDLWEIHDSGKSTNRLGLIAGCLSWLENQKKCIANELNDRQWKCLLDVSNVLIERDPIDRELFALERQLIIAGVDLHYWCKWFNSEHIVDVN